MSTTGFRHHGPEGGCRMLPMAQVEEKGAQPHPAAILTHVRWPDPNPEGMYARQPVLFAYPPLKRGTICQTVRTVKPKSSRGRILLSPSLSEATPFAGRPTYRECKTGKGRRRISPARFRPVDPSGDAIIRLTCSAAFSRVSTACPKMSCCPQGASGHTRETLGSSGRPCGLARG